MVALWTHCRREPDPPEWAAVVGFTNVSWRGDDGYPSDTSPLVGARYVVDVRAPFLADSTFFALWTPALACVNGWDASTAGRLHEMRVVSCRLVAASRVQERSAESLSSGHESADSTARLEVDILDVFDPMRLVATRAPVETDLAGFLLGREHRRSELALDDRRWVETSMQSDVSFSFLLDADERRVVLALDESLCSGFFYAGHGVLSREARQALASVETDLP